MESSTYCPPGFVDGEDGVGNIVQGTWRDDVTCDGLTPLGEVGGNRYIIYIFPWYNLKINWHVIITQILHVSQQTFVMPSKTTSTVQLVKYHGNTTMCDEPRTLILTLCKYFDVHCHNYNLSLFNRSFYYTLFYFRFRNCTGVKSNLIVIVFVVKIQ